MSKRIRKWYVEDMSTQEDWGHIEIVEEGPGEAMWPAEGKESWTLACLNPRLAPLAEENPSIADMGWYARMMAAAPMMRHLLEMCRKDDYLDMKLSKKIRELLENIDNGYDQSEMKESWDD